MAEDSVDAAMITAKEEDEEPLLDDEEEEELPPSRGGTESTKRDDFRRRVTELASSSLDAQSSAVRRAKLALVREALRESDDALPLLALEYKDFACSSLHASRRVVPLYTVACSRLGDDSAAPETITGLCRGLCWLLSQAGNLPLLNAQVDALKASAMPSASLLAQVLFSMATSTTTTATEDDAAIVPAAVALGSALDGAHEWLPALVRHSTTRFAPAAEMALCAPFLHALSVPQWNDVVLPVLTLRVKSHPDRALPTVEGWMQYVGNVVGVVDDEWTVILIKHLLAGKDENSRSAANILVAWAAKSSSSASLAPVALALSAAKPLSAPARVAVYDVLERLVVTASAVEIEASVVDSVLNFLIAMVPKEARAEHRLAGLQATVEWMLVAKRATVVTGYQRVVAELIQKPVQTKKAGDVAMPMLSLLLQRVHADLLPSIVMDVWMPADRTWEKGLEAVLIAAAMKRAGQADGAVVVYLALLYADQAAAPIPPVVAKLIAAGGAVQKADSFLYAPFMMDAVSSGESVGAILPRILALYTQLQAASRKGSVHAPLFAAGRVNAATRALAVCAMHPRTTTTTTTNQIWATERRDEDTIRQSIDASLETILTHDPIAGEALVQALKEEVDGAAGGAEARVRDSNATRDAREGDSALPATGRGSDIGAPPRGFDAGAVRRVAKLLSQHCRDAASFARVLVLLHASTTLQNVGRQRSALVAHSMQILRAITSAVVDSHALPVFRRSLASEIVRMAAGCDAAECDALLAVESHGTSTVLHQAALSLILSLGSIAGNHFAPSDGGNDNGAQVYSFAFDLCTRDIAPLLSSRLRSTLLCVESLSAQDIELHLSPPGTLFRDEATMSTGAVKTSGKRLSEEEEWELQLKKELHEKKNGGLDDLSVALSPEDSKLLAEQGLLRVRLSLILDVDFGRGLASVRSLCSSHIGVGNECLPRVADSVLATAVSVCPAARRLQNLAEKSFEALTALARCVHEIREAHAATIAAALMVSCRKAVKVASVGPIAAEDESNGQFIAAPLPSPCAPAAYVINEMEQFQDTLSGASFSFLLPVIRAALVGPRTSNGCEAALRVLERHTDLLFGDDVDKNVLRLRKDMVISVLELLKHDRAQTFQDPSAFEALVACYGSDAGELVSGPAFTTAELAPLLDERGALGSKNCRVGSMLALSHIAEDHGKLIKSNPLIENRIWLNCFERDDEIRSEARKAWARVNELDCDLSRDDASMPRPSPLYASPLLPLLSHSDPSIALSAAEAYARAMGMHASSVSRNVLVLCTSYIDSFPTADGIGSKITIPTPSVKTKTLSTSAPLSKKISSGQPKKKSPISALAVVGIGQPKILKKKAAHSALLKPKQERTLDQADLAGQFITSGTLVAEKDKDSPARIAVRQGVLRAIAAFTNSAVKVALDEATLKLLTSFLMAYGIADSNDGVKGAARDALRDVVASNGGSDQAVSFLLPHLEAVLKTGVADESTLGSLPSEKVPKDIMASDRRKEGAVVALGSVALHLHGEENDQKVENTVDMLIAVLNTPSEEVQVSVAEALTKLMKKGRTQDRIQSILSDLLRNCLHGESLAVRRGAAYGLSAAVKGSGITTLKKYEIVKQLEEACASGSPSGKEGSLFAIELLSSRLGLLFEPYVIVLLPSLLKAFSDSSDYVRTAANATAGLIMSKLSAHGVKLVMPAVLTAFNDPAWRTKQASIHMLGAMSHLAPKQLASALPKVVPQLTEAFSDTHTSVKASAQEALKEISTVVKNPEISSICPILLKALTDPASHTVKALEALIGTEFLHAIDAPSLALIVPIVHRGLRDRGATTKRLGSLIAGNICTMINDPKDFFPYLPTLLPDLQLSLLDPIPDVRSTSAKALGSLTRSLGDQVLFELRPWLIQKLRDEAGSSAERSGAAQGLTEVLIAAGSTMVEDTMRSEILPLRSYPGAGTREGVLWMLTFLPPAMGQGFTTLIDISLPALISGLSDDSEPVRDVALRAGRVLIRSHGKVHVDKILPSLEAGLGDDDHRIRIASLSLLGDLLSTIGGTQLLKGDGDTQDDIRKAERAQAQIALALGADTRRRILSGLYVARSDSVHMVRQSAIQVWKTVVSVTVRALRDILPVLVAKIIDDLASGHHEKTEVAGRCLGDIVSKLGDSVLPQIIPVLRNALFDGDEHTKRGVCVGLTEVIKCSTKEQILKFVEIIVPVVRDALSDDNEIVRKMASTSFQSLHNIVGSRAMDEVVPSLMVALENGEKDEAARLRALNGLTGILSVRSRELLPYIVPRLIKRPITTNHAEVLAGVARVTGTTIHYHFSAIIPALLGELADLVDGDEEKEEAIRDSSRAICGAVETVGVNWLVSEIASKCGSDKAALRRESCRMFEYVIMERSENLDFNEQVPIMLREMLYRLNDDNEAVLKANHAAFSALSKCVPAEELVKHVEFMRGLIASMVSDARRRKGGVGDGEFLLPGFNMPKGVEPLIPIYQRGILYGSPSIREVSASGLGEIIGFTASTYLAGPLVVKMTGPLLRIVGDRNPSNVKVAILKTLGLVLMKGGPALRAFVPQFQTTFVKALSDPSRQVRVEAIAALALLMPLSTRIDPLIKELIAGSLGKNASVEGLAAAAVQTATLEALATVLDKGGTKAKLPESVPSALEASRKLLASADDGIRESAAKVMGMSCALLGAEATHDLLTTDILNSSDSESSSRQGRASAVRRILASSVGSAIKPTVIEDLKKLSLMFLNDDKGSVREAGFSALGAAIGRASNPKSSLRASESDLLKIMRNSQESIDVHRAVARGLCVALLLIDASARVDFMGLAMMDACLEMALKSSQRVQFAFNDVLWLVLNVSGGEGGLSRYCELAIFDNQRAMKSLHGKVLARIKEISILEQ